VRTRILASYVGLLALATVASVLVARQVLVGQLDGRIDADLRQEAEELSQLAVEGIDPLTARPFGDRVDRIFEVHLQRNIPSRNEALLTFIDGRPSTRSPSVVDYRLDQDAELVELWGTVQDTERGRVDTPAGEVEYLAVPLRADGQVRGVFVAAIFRERALALYTSALVAVGSVGLAMLLVGSTLAWRLAETVLRPVRRVTRTARSINETDLRQRIDVDGQDEVAELATTFNAMLDRLETSFATQRRFLDDAGHELRTPITIARGHLELLGNDPQEQAETVALVLDELERMGRMVNDLLLLAKVEEPSFLERELVDVDVLTDELHAKTRALGDRLWLLESRAEGVVVADRQRLTQAVVQLAQNAVQHTRPGDEIALGSSLEDGELRLWVRDSGPGLAAEEQERVFERFARAPRQPAPRGRRARAVHRAGHRRGARRARGPPQPPRRRGAVHPGAPRCRTGDRRGRAVTRILIVEDEPRISAFLQKGFRAHGFTTELAEDVAEGLARARTGPDLVVLDRGLPDGDGLDVLHELRRSERHVPVILLTARDAVADTVAALDSGADDYMTKPFSFDELLARVRARLRSDRTPTSDTALTAAGIVLDLRTRRARVDGRTVDLSAREFALAEVLLRHPGQVMSRSQLLDLVWGYDYDPGSNVVEVYVGYLRKKLGRQRIESVRGMGYRLVGEGPT